MKTSGDLTAEFIQQKTVGNNVTVGAGAVLLRKPKDGCTYVGVPASMVKY